MNKSQCPSHQAWSRTVQGDAAKIAADRLARSLSGILIVASLCAWTALACQPEGIVHSFCGSSGLSLTAFAISMQLVMDRPGAWFLSSALMTLAMMAPMLLTPILELSLPGRHGRQLSSTVLFVGSYLAFWTVICLPLTIIATVLRMILPAPWPLVLVCIAALAWEVSPAKRARGNFQPKTLDGGLASLGDGIRYGVSCAIACWVLMLLPLLVARAHVGAMAIVTLWLTAAPHAAGFARRLLGPPSILSLPSRETPKPAA